MMKKAASLFLAVLMLVSLLPLQAMAAEPTDLPAADSPRPGCFAMECGLHKV